MEAVARSSIRVIGIDPGLNVTGYGIVVCCPDEVKLLEAGVIRMPRSQVGIYRSGSSRCSSNFGE